MIKKSNLYMAVSYLISVMFENGYGTDDIVEMLGKVGITEEQAMSLIEGE